MGERISFVVPAEMKKALEELLAVTRVDVPEVMVQAEIDRQLGEMDRSLRESGLSLEALASA
ncbi:MAG: hypothetical protein JRN17_04820, partial [Nitrososphaerota archaeon]|nr:hypothetical protein [Nitrososphaerota archaeon]